MRCTPRSVGRGLAAVSLAAFVTMAAGLTPRAHAQAGASDGLAVVVRNTPDLNVPVTKITTFGSSFIYSPNYISNCVHTSNPAFEVTNNTVITQTVTNLTTGAVLTTIPSKQTALFTVNAPGIYLEGLSSNLHTGLIVQCS